MSAKSVTYSLTASQIFLSEWELEETAEKDISPLAERCAAISQKIINSSDIFLKKRTIKNSLFTLIECREFIKTFPGGDRLLKDSIAMLRTEDPLPHSNGLLTYTSVKNYLKSLSRMEYLKVIESARKNNFSPMLIVDVENQKQFRNLVVDLRLLAIQEDN